MSNESDWCGIKWDVEAWDRWRSIPGDILVSSCQEFIDIALDWKDSYRKGDAQIPEGGSGRDLKIWLFSCGSAYDSSMPGQSELAAVYTIAGVEVLPKFHQTTPLKPYPFQK